MTIQPYIPGEEKAIHALIRKVYDEFVAPEYNEEGNRTFYEFIGEQAMSERLTKPGQYLWTAKEDGQICGVIAFRDRSHLALLFVDQNLHGKGIGRALLDHALQFLETREGCRVFTVNSSLFGQEIYRKWGFESTDGVREVNGIKFIPMRLELPPPRFYLHKRQN